MGGRWGRITVLTALLVIFLALHVARRLADVSAAESEFLNSCTYMVLGALVALLAERNGK